MRVELVSCLLVASLAFAAAEMKKAVAKMTVGEVKGNVTFEEVEGGAVRVVGRLEGLSPGNHGFHIHALGDLSKGCASTGSHYNPDNNDHGAPGDRTRHVGDLGNVVAGANGVADFQIRDSVISLRGERSIVGRAVVVHALEDDLGRGGQPDSLTTGHAGDRLACGIIQLQ